MRRIGRWSLRGLLASVAVYAFGWAPIFDWMAPQGIVRKPTAGPRAGASGAGETRPDSIEDGRLVLLVSIDGLAPSVLDTTPTPTLDRLVREGSSASSARTVLPSITMTSHMSMLSGVAPDVHGVRFNRYQPWSRLDIPTVYTECGRIGLRCGLFAGKRKFAHFAEFEPGVQRYRWEPDAPSVLGQALGWLEEAAPDFAMIHLAEVDLSGHDEGWGSEPQRAEIRAIDGHLGHFVDALAQRERRFALIVTADHGGHDKRHGTSRPEDVAIPWIAWGDGVPAGARLRALRTEDTAATVLALLGLEVPEGWSGRSAF